MGKSLGFKFAGKGPGLQKTNKLAKKYLVKGKVKTGKMAELDFGVEDVKVPADRVKTGLSKVRAPAIKPAASATSGSVASSSALGSVLAHNRELRLAEKVGQEEQKRRLGDEQKLRDSDKDAFAEMEAKKAAKRMKKCGPV
mmetsp:Transcript_1315/g.2613  ORF Transcript_1315/g.2613 Transcript_1315/m.2613 type:complete len:141 (+) Transcript_1315:17-439(+)